MKEITSLLAKHNLPNRKIASKGYLVSAKVDPKILNMVLEEMGCITAYCDIERRVYISLDGRDVPILPSDCVLFKEDGEVEVLSQLAVEQHYGGYPSAI